MEVQEAQEQKDPLQVLLDKIRDWVSDPDARPSELRLRRQPIATPHGPGRVFQLYKEDILGQVTEMPEPPSVIVPGTVIPPNGTPRR